MSNTENFVSSLLVQLRSELDGTEENKIATRDKLAIHLAGLIETMRIMIHLSENMGKIDAAEANKNEVRILRAKKHLEAYDLTPLAYRDRRICVVMKNISKVNQRITCSFQN